MDIINRSQPFPFITKDSSQIRELLAYRNSAIRNQSLAEATIAVGTSTQEHYHPKSRRFTISSAARGHETRRRATHVGPLDAVAIPPGARHKILEHRHGTARPPLAAALPLMRMTIR